MAIVKEFKLGATTIKIDDTYFPKTKKERQQRYEEFNRTACRILENELLKKEDTKWQDIKEK